MVQYQSSALPDYAPPPLHESFAALADQTRIAFIERLRRADASITDLADQAAITLTGARKHVKVLESAGLVTTRKEGRTRMCSLGPRRLEREADWIGTYQRTLEERLDRLGTLLETLKEEA